MELDKFHTFSSMSYWISYPREKTVFHFEDFNVDFLKDDQNLFPNEFFDSFFAH